MLFKRSNLDLFKKNFRINFNNLPPSPTCHPEPKLKSMTPTWAPVTVPTSPTMAQIAKPWNLRLRLPISGNFFSKQKLWFMVVLLLLGFLYSQSLIGMEIFGVTGKSIIFTPFAATGIHNCPLVSKIHKVFFSNYNQNRVSRFILVSYFSN
jgi:hypothetical protein